MERQVSPLNPVVDTKVEKLHRHQSRITGLTIVDDTVWTGSFDGTLRVTKISTREEVAVLHGHKDMVACLAVDGEHMWSAGPNGKLMKWAVWPPRAIEDTVLKDPDGKPLAISSIVTVDDDLWLGTGRSIVIVKKNDIHHPVAVLSDPDASTVVNESGECATACGGEAVTPRETDITSDPAREREGRLRAKGNGGRAKGISAHLLRAGAAGEVWSCSFKNGRVHVWDVASQSTKRTFLLDTNGINVLHVVNNCMWCGSVDGSVFIWNLHSHSPIQELRGHTDSVRSICTVHGGKLVASGSGSHDGSIAIYRNDIVQIDELAISGQSQGDDEGGKMHDAFGFFVFQGKDAQSPSFLFAGLAKYTQEDAAHQAEWEEYMASGAGLHDGLGQRLVRRGVPSRYRRQVWNILIERRIKATKKFLGPEYYTRILEYKKGKFSAATMQIDLDLIRTFPNNVFFQDGECRGTASLKNILVAFSWHNPAVGYVQGLNILAAFALLYLEEEEAFWLLVTLVEDLIGKEYYTAPLVQAHADQRVFADLLQRHLPAVHDKLGAEGITMKSVAFNWFFVLFVKSIPTECALSVWDSLLLEGPSVVFRYGLAILKFHEKAILKQTSRDALFNYLKVTIPHTNVPAQLTHIAFEDGPKDLPGLIERLRKKYLGVVRQELEAGKS